jgi:hypothetical protein
MVAAGNDEAVEFSSSPLLIHDGDDITIFHCSKEHQYGIKQSSHSHGLGEK